MTKEQVAGIRARAVARRKAASQITTRVWHELTINLCDALEHEQEKTAALLVALETLCCCSVGNCMICSEVAEAAIAKAKEQP